MQNSSQYGLASSVFDFEETAGVGQVGVTLRVGESGFAVYGVAVCGVGVDVGAIDCHGAVGLDSLGRGFTFFSGGHDIDRGSGD